MSPIGEAFRVRCRMFPSLINCCTIDWWVFIFNNFCPKNRLFLYLRFMLWPDDALEKVANMFLSQTDISDEMRAKCVAICKHFHTSVQNASEEFYTLQKRRIYVTPTSYLELIQTFKNLYYIKVDQITMQRNRSA